MNESKSESLQRTHASVSAAVRGLLEQGLDPGQIAAVMVSSAFAVLEIDDPHRARTKLLYLAARVSGAAREVHSDEQ
jgi:hypothetical protein